MTSSVEREVCLGSRLRGDFHLDGLECPAPGCWGCSRRWYWRKRAHRSRWRLRSLLRTAVRGSRGCRLLANSLGGALVIVQELRHKLNAGQKFLTAHRSHGYLVVEPVLVDVIEIIGERGFAIPWNGFDCVHFGGLLLLVRHFGFHPFSVNGSYPNSISRRAVRSAGVSVSGFGSSSGSTAT